jgi:hypothetical protein
MGLTTSLPSVSRLYRTCGSLDLSQPYGPSWPVTGIVIPNIHQFSHQHFALSKILHVETNSSNNLHFKIESNGVCTEQSVVVTLIKKSQLKCSPVLPTAGELKVEQ